jgi:hypothetical protein
LALIEALGTVDGVTQIRVRSATHPDGVFRHTFDFVFRPGPRKGDTLAQLEQILDPDSIGSVGDVA